MTETSLVWGGVTTGDASIAPYDDQEFTRLFSKLFTSDGVGYVVPSYNNSLNVTETSTPAASVDVDTGAAYIKGYLYDNDAVVTLTIAANASGNPRLDRVILRIDWAAQTIRTVILEGTAAATPTLAALTQTYGTTWEISLAYIYVGNGFATITDEDIHDERKFITTSLSNSQSDSRSPLNDNSEWMVITNQSGNLPGDWRDINGLSATATASAKPSEMLRGQALQITANANGAGIQKIIAVKPSTTYTMKFLINVTAGDICNVSLISTGGAGVSLQRDIERTGSFIEETIILTTGASDDKLLVRFEGTTSGDIFQLGQILIVEGWETGPFREIKETIYFSGVDSTTYNGSGQSTGALTIQADVDFGSNASIALGTKAAYYRFRINDSGSAAGTPFLGIESGSGTALHTIRLSGVTNDEERDSILWVMLEKGATNTIDTADSTMDVTASGAGTMDITLSIHGVIV